MICCALCTLIKLKVLLHQCVVLDEANEKLIDPSVSGAVSNRFADTAAHKNDPIHHSSFRCILISSWALPAGHSAAKTQSPSKPILQHWQKGGGIAALVDQAANGSGVERTTRSVRHPLHCPFTSVLHFCNQTPFQIHFLESNRHPNSVWTDS